MPLGVNDQGLKIIIIIIIMKEHDAKLKMPHGHFRTHSQFNQPFLCGYSRLPGPQK